MRVNFEANDGLMHLIDTLQQRTGSTKKGVIVGALQLLRWALDQQDRGHTIAAIGGRDDTQPIREYHSELLLQAQNS